MGRQASSCGSTSRLLDNAPIHNHSMPGNEPRIVRHQKCNHVRNILRLSEPLRSESLAGGGVRPFLSEHLALMHGWVEVPYAGDLPQLVRLAHAAHAAAGRGRKPAKRRFRRAAHRRGTA